MSSTRIPRRTEAAPRDVAPGRTGRSRRAAQSFVEFSLLAVAMLGFVLLVIVFAFYLLQSWALSNVVASVGRTITTTGYLDTAAMQHDATSFYVSLGSPEDTVTVEVRNANGIPLCEGDGQLGSDGRTCTYDGWVDALDPETCGTSGCDPVAGSSLRVNYGDFVRVKVSRTGRSPWLLRWFGVSDISATWSGIAQRNTVTAGYGDPITTGSLAVTVLDPGSTPVTGATVVLLPGGTTRTTPASGIASFSGIAAGTYLASVRAFGYQPSQLSLTISPDYPTTADANLSDVGNLDLYLVESGPGDHLTNGGFETSGGWAPGTAGSPDFATTPSSSGTTGSDPYAGSVAGTFTTTPGVANGGIINSWGSSISGNIYRGLVWVRAPADDEVAVTLGSLGGTLSTVTVTGIGDWQRVSIDWTADGVSPAVLAVRDAREDPSDGVTIDVDDAIVYDTSVAPASSPTPVIVTSGEYTASGFDKGLFRFSLSVAGSYSVSVSRGAAPCTLTPAPGAIPVTNGKDSTRVAVISGC